MHRKIDLVHQIPSIINHKALPMATTRRPYIKLTCLPFSYYRSKGTSLPLPPETRHCTLRETLRSLVHWKKHKLCLSISYYYTYNHTYIVATGRTDDKPLLQSLFVQTTMEPLPHGLWSCLPASH